MEALRLIAEPVNHQLVIDLPPSLEGRRLEVIVFPVATEEALSVLIMPHKPNPRLAGTVILHDDFIAPACPEEDWDVMR